MKNKEYILAAITVIIWGTQAACAKFVMANISVMNLLFYESFFACITLIIINMMKGGIHSFTKYNLKDYTIISSLGFVGIFLYTTLYYFGIHYLTSSVACIINYAWPAMIVLFSCIILKEKLTLYKVISIVFAFIGVMIISLQGGIHTLFSGNIIGILSCLLAAILYGFYSVMNKKYNYDQWIMLCVAFGISAIFSSLYCIVTHSFSFVHGSDYLWLLWIGVMGNGIAYVLWGIALNTGTTAKISILAYLTPFINLIFGRILLNEHISIISFIGLILIIGGVLIQMKEE